MPAPSALQTPRGRLLGAKFRDYAHAWSPGEGPKLQGVQRDGRWVSSIARRISLVVGSPSMASSLRPATATAS